MTTWRKLQLTSLQRRRRPEGETAGRAEPPDHRCRPQDQTQAHAPQRQSDGGPPRREASLREANGTQGWAQPSVGSGDRSLLATGTGLTLTIGTVPVAPDISVAAKSVMPDVVAVQTEPLDGGSSAFVALLTLESADGQTRRVVFRQHTDRTLKEHTRLVASKEFHLTQALSTAGFAVPRPLALHGDHTSNGPWLVTEWINGSTAVGQAEIDTSLVQMADFLARLHAVDPDHINVPGLTEIEDPEQVLSTCLPNDKIGDAVQRTLNAGVQRRPNANVLLHGDFWPGNVMFNHQDLVAVLDWEDATWGDPLADLACARVELTCAYGPEASARFTARYVSSIATARTTTRSG